jgi:hypothetical protein
MSITFWAPDAPTRMVRPYTDEPDYEEARSDLPELNVSQFNARPLLELVGLPPEDAGTVQAADMGPLISRLMVLTNQNSARAQAVRPGGELPRAGSTGVDGEFSPRGPRVIDGGLEDSRLQRYVSTLLELFTQARRAGYSVSWG